MMALTAGLVGLADIRDAAGVVLAPETDTDPIVLVDVVDSLEPPAIMLVWDDPWLEPGTSGRPTMGPCELTARLAVMCIAARLEPGAGVRTVEQLVAYTVERMKADTYTWRLNAVGAPRIYTIGNVDYLGARITYLVPTST
jgi:hypothetical protein